MREIKFRAWDGMKKEMIYPRGEDMTDHVTSASLLAAYNDGGLSAIMQFTGLKDNNGKDVFESDIVKIEIEGDESIHAVIWWGDNYPSFELEGWEGESNGLSEAANVGTIEVIGNIYENSELLNPPMRNPATA